MNAAVGDDQAAGLRQWAGKQKRRETTEPATADVASAAGEGKSIGTKQTLVVVGLPSASYENSQCVVEQLERYAAAGKQWVGDPQQWDIVVAEMARQPLQQLAAECQRWVLWVEPDINGFQRAYYGLKTLQQAGAPKRVLLMHPPIASSRGLITNVEGVAERFFGTQLIRVQVPHDMASTVNES
ncbi:hypothetical protein [Aliidiomarina haloalkalitolerans]|uniref:Uncharacterized protein n=1 Tax=Aliidiomarina haloalkalitolerans TaxID=859059 RepID=A0A432VW05_9GAMM|nr:hypothetical protein [Aliidiomarina haloalkalitolerans]MCL4410697.1 hypothetical protein [Gammaproteobacteria bacterium]RUO20766.1 hypothetical protein CWE06_05540 [Aliidiomarina haloalkalitolerans]